MLLSRSCCRADPPPAAQALLCRSPACRGCLQAPTALLAIPVAAASARAAAAASRPGRELQQRSSANRLWQHHIVRPRRAVRAAASAGGQQPSDAAEPEESEEFLWRYLQHKQGFTAEAVQRMQQTMEQAGRNIRCDKAWVLRNVEPSMRLLLRDEKLTPEVMQQLCRKWPYLLAEDYTSFATCMAELRRRQLAEDVPEDRRAPALPDGTRLGAELCRRPAVLAELLCWPFLDSCIAITRAAHCKLGICSGDTAAALLQSPNILATDDGQAEAMVSHLHGLIASGVQSQEQGGRVLMLRPGGGGGRCK